MPGVQCLGKPGIRTLQRTGYLYTEDGQQHSRCPPSPSLFRTCQVPAGLTALCWVSDTLCCGTPGSHPRGLSRACWEQNTGTRMDHCALSHCRLSCIKLRESGAWKSTHRSCQPSVPHVREVEVLLEQTLRGHSERSNGNERSLNARQAWTQCSACVSSLRRHDGLRGGLITTIPILSRSCVLQQLVRGCTS